MSHRTGRQTGCIENASSSSNAGREAEFQQKYEALPRSSRPSFRGGSEQLMRPNTFDPATQTITVDPVRAEAFEANLRHYSTCSATGNADYAIPKGTQSDPDQLRQLAAFFFWTSWAASTNRPGERHSPTRATGRTSRWSAIGPPARPSSGPA